MQSDNGNNNGSTATLTPAVADRKQGHLGFPFVTDEFLSMVDSEDLIKEIIRRIGEKVDRSGLAQTPHRVVKSWTELYRGYHDSPAIMLKTLFDEDGYDEMAICRNIEFYSMCEHHMLPFFGTIHIGYLPSRGKVVGLSKLARLVDIFAHRLQVQERLTKQIAEAMMSTEMCSGVGVTVEAKHMCMCARGVRKQESEMVTSMMLGTFRENLATREEFLFKTSRC